MDDWPALSADLNLVDHCWDYLKKRIRKLQLDNVRDLQNAIRRVAKIPAGLYPTSGEVYEAWCDVDFRPNEKKDNKQCLSDTPRWSMKKINIKNTKAIQNG